MELKGIVEKLLENRDVSLTVGNVVGIIRELEGLGFILQDEEKQRLLDAALANSPEDPEAA